MYCHSGFTRPQDHFVGQFYLYPRVSEPGDYWEGAESPNIFGTARTGPDLSQEAGSHPNDWHDAHYWSPRATTPIPIMPRFNFLSDEERRLLIAITSLRRQRRLSARSCPDGSQEPGVDQLGGEDRQVYPDLVQQLNSKAAWRMGRHRICLPGGCPGSPWGELLNGVTGFLRSWW